MKLRHMKIKANLCSWRWEEIRRGQLRIRELNEKLKYLPFASLLPLLGSDQAAMIVVSFEKMLVSINHTPWEIIMRLRMRRETLATKVHEIPNIKILKL